MLIASHPELRWLTAHRGIPRPEFLWQILAAFAKIRGDLQTEILSRGQQAMPGLEQPHSPPVRRARRRIRIWLLIVLAVSAGALWAYRRHFTIHVSPETTYITAPLLPNGRPDYLGYLARKHSPGINPENNAALLIFQVINPSHIPQSVREQPYAELGIPVPLPENCLVTINEFMTRDNLWGHEREFRKFQQGELPPGEFPELERWVEENEKPLRILEEASRRSRYYIPFAPRHLEAGTVRFACGILTTRSLLRLKAGDLEGACADTVTLHRLGRLISQSVFPEDRRSGFNFAYSNFSPAGTIFASGKLSLEQIQEFRRSLADMPELPPLEGCVEYLRISPLASITKWWRNKEYPEELNPWLAPNELLRMINRHHDRYQRNLRITDHMERTRELALHRQENKERAEKLRPSSWTAPGWHKWVQMVVGDSFPPRRPYYFDESSFLRSTEFPDLSFQELYNQMQFQWLHVTAAIAEHRARTGQLPVTLADLDPRELAGLSAVSWSEVPLDYLRHEDSYSLKIRQIDLGLPRRADYGVE